MGKNNNVSCEDVDLANKNFKADVPTLKGKGTSPKPPVVKTIE